MGAPGRAASRLPAEWTRLHHAARVAWSQGDFRGAGVALKNSYLLARRVGHPEAARRSLLGLEKVYLRLDDPTRARKMHELAETLAAASDTAADPVTTPPPRTTEEALAVLREGDPEAMPGALADLERRASRGDVLAARVLGALHVEGRLVVPDMARGLAWIDRAIAGGDRDSMIYKAELAERGLGMPLDRALARDLYRQAAEAGSPVAAYRLGADRARRGAVEEAERWLTAAAELGSSRAQVDLGVLLYRQGDRDDAAADWFHRAAREENPEGLYNLALCLLQGRGVVADRVLATEYLRQAAAAGLPHAVDLLAKLELTAEPAAD